VSAFKIRCCSNVRDRDQPFSWVTGFVCPGAYSVSLSTSLVNKHIEHPHDPRNIACDTLVHHRVAIQITKYAYVLIITYLSFALPFVIWLMSSFFETIPVELEESARIDGCSRLGYCSESCYPFRLLVWYQRAFSSS